MITPAQLLTLPPDIVERAQRLAPAQREIVLLTLVGFSRAEIARLRGSKEPAIHVSLRWAQKKIGRIPYTVERRRGTTGTEEESARRRRSQRQRRDLEAANPQSPRLKKARKKMVSGQRRRREREIDDRLDQRALATMRPLDQVSAVDFMVGGQHALEMA